MISFRQADLMQRVQDEAHRNQRRQAEIAFESSNKGSKFQSYNFDDIKIGEMVYNGELYIAFDADYQKGYASNDYYEPSEPAGYAIQINGQTVLPGEAAEYRNGTEDLGNVYDPAKLQAIAQAVFDQVGEENLEQDIEKKLLERD